MGDNTRTCNTFIQSYDTIVFKNLDYQNAADMIYVSKVSTIAASRNGTLGIGATGNPTFKSDFERMQYLLGQQKVASCGVPAKTFKKDSN